MLVYRLEHPNNGEGPHANADVMDAETDRRPVIDWQALLSRDEPIPYRNRLYGCVSYAALRWYFGDDWQHLMGLGYAVKVYRVDEADCLADGFQVVFNSRKADDLTDPAQLAYVIEAGRLEAA